MVHKGANLTVYVILDQLERYKKKYKRFPKKLLIQIDGGSENANDEVVAWLETLTAKQLIPEIYLTRLPVGHTHEDIDALFGTMWVYFRLRPCLTLEAYMQGILDCFSGESKIEAAVEDVNIIPDYCNFIRPFCDEISRWAKEQLTVHQIHIYACTPTVYFPHGYAFRYRDYVSDKVVEMKAVDKRSAVTPVGHMTGIEPVTHHSKWYPDENTYENRPVSGIFNLREIPNTDPVHGIQPINFLDDDIIALLTIKQSIVGSKLFPTGSVDRQKWMLWFQSVLPVGGSLKGEEYIKTHEYKQPLSSYLSGKNKNHLSASVLADLETSRSKVAGMSSDWPEDIVSYATPHVNLRQWKNLVIPPRQYRYLSAYVQTMTKIFQDSTEKYYQEIAERYNIDKILNILARRINTQGKHDPLNGTKKDLVARLFTGDYERFATIYHPIRDKSQEDLVQAYWNDGTHQSIELTDATEIVEKSRKSRVYTLTRQLNNTTGRIQNDSFLKILGLIKARDLARKQGFEEFYKVTEGSRRYRESIFLTPQFGSNFFVLSDFDEARFSDFVDIDDIKNIHLVYIPVKSENALVVLNIAEKEFWYFNADPDVRTIDEAKEKGQE